MNVKLVDVTDVKPRIQDCNLLTCTCPACHKEFYLKCDDNPFIEDLSCPFCKTKMYSAEEELAEYELEIIDKK